MARRTAKQAQITAKETQLTIIIGTINPELQATLLIVTGSTTIKSFINEVESRADL